MFGLMEGTFCLLNIRMKNEEEKRGRKSQRKLAFQKSHVLWHFRKVRKGAKDTLNAKYLKQGK
jgi:hypothetical protein